MIALAGVTVALAVGLAIAVWQALALADQVDDLKGQRDRAVRDREASARAFAARALLEAAYDLHRDADQHLRQGTETSKATAESFHNVADWLEQIRVPELRRRTTDTAEATR